MKFVQCLLVKCFYIKERSYHKPHVI